MAHKRRNREKSMNPEAIRHFAKVYICSMLYVGRPNCNGIDSCRNLWLDKQHKNRGTFEETENPFEIEKTNMICWFEGPKKFIQPVSMCVCERAYIS